MTCLDFVKAWLSHNTVYAMSAATGIDTHSIHNIATAMRRQGVKLPKMKAAKRRGPKPKPVLDDYIDPPALNKFILER